MWERWNHALLVHIRAAKFRAMASGKGGKKKSKATPADIAAAISTADPATSDEQKMIAALEKGSSDPTLRPVLELIETIAANKGTGTAARSVLSRIESAGDEHAKQLSAWLEAAVAEPQSANTLTKALVGEVERQIPNLETFVRGDWAQARIDLDKDAGDDALPASVRSRAGQLRANLAPERVTMLTGLACAALYLVVVVIGAAMQP